MARYLVTGGAGFIGSNIVEELVKRNEEVVVLDNLSTGKLENISEFKHRVDFINGDVRDLMVCKAVCKGIDFVLHQAALGSVPRSIRDPGVTNACNVEGTLNMLEASKSAGVKRFVYASSASVYGNSGGREPKNESMPTNPANPYAVSKLAGENYVKVYNGIHGLPTIALRYFNVFGPKQNPEGVYAAVVPKFVTGLLNGNEVVIEGDGEQSRDFTYVQNIVDANILACEAEENACGSVFNVGAQQSTTVNQLFMMIAKFVGIGTNPVHVSQRLGDIRYNRSDITAAINMLGYCPRINVFDGIRLTVDWYKEPGEI